MHISIYNAYIYIGDNLIIGGIRVSGSPVGLSVMSSASEVREKQAFSERLKSERRWVLLASWHHAWHRAWHHASWHAMKGSHSLIYSLTYLLTSLLPYLLHSLFTPPYPRARGTVKRSATDRAPAAPLSAAASAAPLRWFVECWVLSVERWAPSAEC